MVMRVKEWEPDYTREYAGSPGVGDEVKLDRPHRGHPGGVVRDIIRGALGPLLVVELPDGTRADYHWQRLTPRFVRPTRTYTGRLVNNEPIVTYLDGVSPAESNPNAPVILDPGPSQALRNHSPDGFAWGYQGSGPAQLALALLLDATGGDTAAAGANYQEFKRAFVGNWSRLGPWVMTAEEIREWLKARPAADA